MTRSGALVAAFLLAPIVPAAAITVGTVFSFGNGPKGLISFPVWYGFALVAELLLGGPLILVAWRLRLITWWVGALAGGLVGFAVLFILSFHLPQAGAAAGWSALGAMGGLVFWLVARQGKGPAPRG